MIMLGMTFDAARVCFGWGSILDIARNLTQDSATWRALYPEQAAFISSANTNYILANIYDAIMSTQHSLVAVHSRTKPRFPKPYPRPGLKDTETRTFGKDPIPVREFNSWYYGENIIRVNE